MTGRKNIYELISENIDVNREFANIEYLWSQKSILSYASKYNYQKKINNCTIEEYVDIFLFYNWKARYFSMNCTDFKNRIKTHSKDLDEIDKILVLMEYYKNILELFIREACPFSGNICVCNFFPSFYILRENINLLIEKLSLQAIYDKDKELISLVPKSAEAIATAEISSDKTGLAILKYHHALLKGQLEEKRQILEAIAIENEQLLKKPPQECKTLCDKTRGLINTMNIRHNNTKDSEVFARLNPKEQEEWYDEIYQMLLLCILENDNIARMKRVKQVFKDMKDE